MGRPDWTDCESQDPPYTPTQTKMLSPQGLYYDSSSGKVFVGDGVYNRILIYNSIPSNGTPADTVVGQADFTSVDESGTTTAKIFGNYGFKVFSNKLFVTDYSKGRVLIFNSIPATDYASADLVIGKPNMTNSADAGVHANTLYDPSGVDWDGTSLLVGDTDNNRVLLYSGIPTANQPDAIAVFGQTDMTSSTVSTASATTLSMPSSGIVHSGDYLFVSDTGHNRILRYTNNPAQIQANSETTVTTTQKEVVVNSSDATTISVPASVPDASVNIDALTTDDGSSTSATLPAITLNVATSLSNKDVDVAIPSGAVITAPPGWNGIIHAPQIKDNASVNPPADTGKISFVSSVIEVGYDDVSLTFDKAVRIFIPDRAGKEVGYLRNGTFTAITAICAGDSQTDGNNLPSGGECRIDVGGDLVLWTKHFTKFVTYEQSSGIVPEGFHSTTEAEVCTREKPVSRPDLYRIDAGSTQATLFFTPINTNNTGYYISYGTRPGVHQFGAQIEKGYSSGSVAFVVNQLKPNSTYYFTVRGQNGCMTGDWGNEMKIATGLKGSKRMYTYNEYKPVKRAVVKRILPTAKTYKAAKP